VKIVVVHSPAPRQVRQWTLDFAAGGTLLDALHASSIFDEFPELAASPLTVGVWGRRADERYRLHDGDRVEIYRALKVDPKLARRQRFIKQGSRSAGLFAGTRPGAKAGY
jgi:putative ubiquitin-RnfH superfamily antitoxin RatB of RatAB toxin-antitoxin module